MVGLATRQRDNYYQQAERLARRYPDMSKLEKRMVAEGRVIVKGLRDQQMKFDEYARALIDKTLVSALAAVYLGAGENRPKDKMEKAWPSIVGGMLPPLVTFLQETKDYIDDGVLKYKDDSVDFADMALEDVLQVNPELAPDYSDDGPKGTPAQVAAALTATQSAVGKSWRSLNGRVIRYIATPIYSFFNLGVFMNMQEGGYKEMRRIAHLDKRCCPDCIAYDAAGWQPMGALPMPGRGCRCWDRCRCRLEYR